MGFSPTVCNVIILSRASVETKIEDIKFVIHTLLDTQ